LNERILAGQRIAALGRDDSIGDAIHASHRDQRRLGVERLGRVHVGHDLVAQFNQIVGHLFGGDFREAELRLGIDQARIDCHAGHIDDLRTAGDVDGSRRADGSDLPALQNDRAVLNYAVSNSQQLATFENDRLVLRGDFRRPNQNCHPEQCKKSASR
jgi:hypothetical protein